MGFSERFNVTRVSDRQINGNQTNGTTQQRRSEITLNVGHLDDSPPAFEANGHFTKEPLPRLEYYRQSKRAQRRPSLGELHGDVERKPDVVEEDDGNPAAGGHGHKLGWIEGVMIPCLLNIWGVMLFLRMAWIVAESGISQSLLIIAISYAVCVITTLSLSAICTNGDVKGGGLYYLISRSLGPEFGASVGVVFAFANAVNASMNTIGFCDSLNDLLKSFGTKIIDGGVNDTRIVGTIAILVMVCICAIGMEWEAKAQNFLLVTIVIAIFDFLIGAFLTPSNEDIAQGFTGPNLNNFENNWEADYRFSEGMDQNFFTVFAIFFPSVTGLQAGANICGDLKDPATAIPKGTLLALLISGISYVSFVFMAGYSAARDASGNITDIINGTLSEHPACLSDFSCEYGLHNSYTIMQLMSFSSAVIYAGCWAATLSTALTNLLSVPRLIQALGIDKIYPGLIFFSKGYGKNGEPYRGYVLVFLVSSAFVLIANLNIVAPLISNMYLASYALINFCTFHAATVKPLGWRPSFRFYNRWLSLFGSISCIAIMFLIDVVSTVITFVVIFGLYWVVVYRKPDVNWGSSTQAQTYKTALSSAFKLEQTGEHVKNYHPQVLVLSGNPTARPPLIDLANLITKNNSLLLIGNVVSNRLSHKKRKALLDEGNNYLQARKVKSFYRILDGIKIEEGVRAMIQSTGFGKLAPNVVLYGYKSDWRTCNPQDLKTYFNVLHDAFDSRMSVVILRLPGGQNFSHVKTDVVQEEITSSGIGDSGISLNINGSTGELNQRPIMHQDSNLNLQGMVNNSPTEEKPKRGRDQKLYRASIVYSTKGGASIPKEIINAIDIFQIKHKGTIDVWWLYDDGGLTILIPYIIHMRSNWSSCKIRVFALTNNKMDLEVEQKEMANLLAKLRIEYSTLTMLQGVTDKPQSMTTDMHEKMISKFMEGKSTNCFISNAEKAELQEKTNRQLRMRELLLEHSNNASLIVMSMPMPRQGTISAPLYMSWLEILTKDMPPFVLVRGNQSSVLSFNA